MNPIIETIGRTIPDGAVTLRIEYGGASFIGSLRTEDKAGGWAETYYQQNNNPSAKGYLSPFGPAISSVPGGARPLAGIISAIHGGKTPKKDEFSRISEDMKANAAVTFFDVNKKKIAQ